MVVITDVAPSEGWARGEIFAFTDPDCEAESGWLERIAADVRAVGVGILLGRRLAATEHGLLKLIMYRPPVFGTQGRLNQAVRALV